MESAEKIVEAYARHLKRLATIANIRCDGEHEIDLLAIDPSRPARRFHIEVGVSLPPDPSHANGKARDPDSRGMLAQPPRTRRALDDFIKNKFDPEAVSRKLREYGFERGSYQKVVVTWNHGSALKAAAEGARIELWNFKSMLQELTKFARDNPMGLPDDTRGALDLFGKAKLEPDSFTKTPPANARLSAVELWNSKDPKLWDHCESALYDAKVKPENRDIERELEKPGLRARIARMSVAEFYNFLRDEYYGWKFTSKPQLTGALNALAKHAREGTMDLVETARQRLVNRAYDSKGGAIRMMMGRHGGILGLTVAGASGLLALVYPEEFGTVDTKVAKALQEIGAPEVMNVNPKDISIAEAEAMIEIMRIKALELNRAFGANKWTPRRIDRALWVVGH